MTPLPCLSLMLLLLVAPAAGALALPGVPVPRLPVDPGPLLSSPLDRAGHLPDLRQLQIRDLLRRHRIQLDTDRRGAPVVRGEVIAIDPTPQALQQARDAGFAVVRDVALEGLALRVVVLAVPPGKSTRRALKHLQRLDPQGSYDHNHLYLGSGEVEIDTRLATPAAHGRAGPWRVGLVDSGVDPGHPALRGVVITHWGCEGQTRPAQHGTAVASLLSGSRDPQTGSGAQLYAADIYCDEPTGGAVTTLANAFAWLARERVAVINVSLVGPPNLLMQRLVQSMHDRGHVLVAAVGNDGPAAPPLYPAAYPGVIGVTAVDRRDRLLPEAGRGEHVDLAAPGADLQAAAPGAQWSTVRGTSFAAPLVARLAAMQATSPTPGLAGEVLDALGQQARMAGARGDDARFGRGIVGTSLRDDWSAPVNQD